MIHQFETFQLENILTEAAELGALRLAVSLGLVKQTLSKSEAYIAYGRGTVDRWIAEGLIKPAKDGSNSSKLRLDRLRLEALAKGSNRLTYLPVSER